MIEINYWLKMYLDLKMSIKTIISKMNFDILVDCHIKILKFFYSNKI